MPAGRRPPAYGEAKSHQGPPRLARREVGPIKTSHLGQDLLRRETPPGNHDVVRDDRLGLDIAQRLCDAHARKFKAPPGHRYCSLDRLLRHGFSVSSPAEGTADG